MRGADYVSAAQPPKSKPWLLAEENAALGAMSPCPSSACSTARCSPRPNPENNRPSTRKSTSSCSNWPEGKAGAIPVGYVDKPGAGTLGFIGLPIEKIPVRHARRPLPAACRLVVQRPAPTARAYSAELQYERPLWHRSGGDRIAFAYMNMAQRTGAGMRPSPGWRCPAGLRRIRKAGHRARHANCEPVRYPYVLAGTVRLSSPRLRLTRNHADAGDDAQRDHAEISLKAANKLLTSHRR